MPQNEAVVCFPAAPQVKRRSLGAMDVCIIHVCCSSIRACSSLLSPVASPGFGARGAQVEAPRGWCPLPTRGGVWEGGCAPSPENFLNFYVKIVSSGAFWVAISYRLAACFTESEVRVELKFIGDRSGILGTIITP